MMQSQTSRELVYVAFIRVKIQGLFWLLKRIFAAAGNFGLVEQEHLFMLQKHINVIKDGRVIEKI